MTYTDFVLTGVGQPISINMEYQPAPPTNASATPTFRNITVANFLSTGTRARYHRDFQTIDMKQKSAGAYTCLPESPCREMAMNAVQNTGGSGARLNSCTPRSCMQATRAGMHTAR